MQAATPVPAADPDNNAPGARSDRPGAAPAPPDQVSDPVAGPAAGAAAGSESPVAPEDWQQAWNEGRQLARVLDLPLRRRTWRGLQGGYQGSGSGASLDFQDHRHYLPGDDPRHINWQAFARTGHYTMKVFREEVRPMVDLVLDASASMHWPAAKARTAAALLALVIDSAERTGAALRVWLVAGDHAELIGREQWRAGDVFEPWSALAASGRTELPHPPSIGWRSGSLRVVISDLLAPADPAAWSAAVLNGSSAGLLLAPWTREESRPDWNGNLELLCVESGRRRLGVIGEAQLKRYCQAWQNHMDLWRAGCRRGGMALAMVEGGLPLFTALQAEALPQGLLEPCS